MDGDGMVEPANALSRGAYGALEALLSDPRVSRTEIDRLDELIATSPRLVRSLNTAVAAGSLARFQVQDEAVHAGGQYIGPDRTITLPLGSLLTSDWGGQADTIYVRGHEMQHAHNADATRDAWNRFISQTHEIADTGGSDFADVLNESISASRADEDRADLEGWNTLWP